MLRNCTVWLELDRDLNEDGDVNAVDVNIWVNDLRRTWIGDANADGEFDSADFVDVFVAGKYEVDDFAVWSEGDWDVDGRFSSSDMVKAFEEGGYEQGTMTDVVAVPEPATAGLLLTALCLVVVQVRRVDL